MLNPENIELDNIKFIGGLNGMRTARQLSHASHAASEIKRELPYPAAHYETTSKAYRRLLSVGKNAQEHGLAAFVIREGSTGIGIATMQRAEPNPNPRHIQRSAEVSYWHADTETAPEAIMLGRTVLNELITRKSTLPYDESRQRLEALWMVTLPDDEVKAEVCQQTEFSKAGSPQVYTIEDGVTIPRQLWVRNV